MTIKKAVITAGARGNRLYPVADTIQKEMLPVIDTDGISKPIIQIIIEEALSAGIEEVCIVCAPGDDKRYVESFNKLHAAVLETDNLGSESEKQAVCIKNILQRLSFAVQDKPHGYGHAVFCAESFVGNEPFLLLTGDYLYTSYLPDKRCAQQLIQLAVAEDCSVSAVNPTPEYLIGKYGTLTGNTLIKYQGVYQIEKIIEKPSVTQAELELHTTGLRTGFYLCFFGMSVFQPSVFSLLEEYIRKNRDEIILLTPVLQELASKDKYLALEIKGNRYDTSKKLGLIQAQLALGLAGTIKDDLLTVIIQSLAESNKRNSG